MTIKIVYRPENLGYTAFKAVEMQCFPDEPIDADKFEEWVTRDFWAVFDGHRLVGYGYLILKPELGWISRLGVATDHRNKGIGSRLMKTMIDYCRQNNRARIMLYVQQDNPSAIRLYRKYGFDVSEVTYQYVIPIQRFLNSYGQSASQMITAVPLPQVDAGSWPSFPPEWADINKWHRPPDNYVLLFQADQGQIIGYCRLDPAFPGCFPFVVNDDALKDLANILISLQGFLNPEKEILKLTFSGTALAEACEGLDFELNYKTFKMERGLTDTTVYEV